MPEDAFKESLHRYLQVAREAMLWKLDGLSEYDVRRPLVPTGTNLLGLVKHLASVDLEYFTTCFGRPSGEDLSWFADDAEDGADMWASPDESREFIVDLYRRVWVRSDATIEELPLDATATVPWWPEERRHPTLHLLLVHMTAETHRHAGHADICRELIDGAIGHRQAASNLPDYDASRWAAFHDRVEAAAATFR